MKPQTVLKIDPVGKSAAQIYARRDQWIAEYQKYIRENPQCEDLGAVLIDRITRAAEMLVRRYAQVPLEAQERPDPESDFHYDDYNPAYKEENASLDGNFPLGDAYDADFATPYFPIEHLVLIQFGDSDKVPRGHYVEPAYDVLVRQGFLHELNQQWREAEACYSGGGMSKSVFRREMDCRNKKNRDAEMAYGKAQHYMESGQWSQAQPYLEKAAALEYADAMADLGLAKIYGTLGVPVDYDEGLELLRRAAQWHHNQRACMELVELYDNGASGIDGDDAEKYCRMAAEAGDKKAIARLDDGFDTRPLIEIMQEQVAKGNTDAVWWMYQSAVKRQCPEESRQWYDLALEAGHPEALLEEAENHPEQEAWYLHRAADKGNIPAMLRLSRRELEAGDTDFWQAALKLGEGNFAVAPALLERHLRQFAWIKKTADTGDGDALYHLAVAYWFGYPLNRDEAEAAWMAAKAADKGNPTAMYFTAWLLENGRGCQRDLDLAVGCYERAAENGIMAAMLRLHEIYKDGLEHIPADQEKASRYLWMSGVGRP